MELQPPRYTKGISARNRRLLDRIHRASQGAVTVREAAKILDLSAAATAKLLSQWHAQGWLSRVRRGLYVPVPLGSGSPAAAVADPWAIMAKAFAPCYIGGWSACEHWGFTEQLFRAVLVVTTKPVRPRKGELQGTPFVARVTAPDRFFGSRRVWREQTPIDVSDPSRTIIDILNEPGLGGGIRHVAQVLQSYFRSEYRDDRHLLEYGHKLGNRTVFKRLGFLVERLGIDAPALVSECRARLTAGYSRLDPTGPKKGNLLRRWNLLINIEVPSSR